MKDKENIYDLLNDLTMDFEDYPQEELSEIEKQRLKKAMRKNGIEALSSNKSSSNKISFHKFSSKNLRSNNFKKVGTIAIALLLSLGLFTQTGWGKAVYAATESKVAEISYSIGQALGIERNIEPYANVVNQVVESNGVEMKLAEVIIDKDELILSVITRTDKPVQWLNFDYDIFINGKKVRNYSASGTGGPIDKSQRDFNTVYAIDISGIDTMGDVDLKVVLKNLSYYLGDEITEKVKGKWKFEFVASGSELTANSRTLAIDHEFYIGDTKYTLEEFRYNPVNQKIYGKAEGQSAVSYDVDLRGWDNLGNEVKFYLSRVSDGNLTFNYQNFDGDLSNEITSLTLIPYAVKLPEQSGKISGDWQQVGEEFTIYLK